MPSAIGVVSHVLVSSASDAQFASSVQSRLASQYWYVYEARPEAFAPPGSFCVEVRETVWRIECATFSAAGSSMVAVGGVRSSSHVHVSGVASMLPAASIEWMSTVCVPSAGAGEYAFGLVHGAHAPVSMRHSKVAPGSFDVNVNAGAGSFVGSPGFVWIVVFGSVRSTVTVEIVVDWWPTLSVATAWIAYAPSAGMGQAAWNGAALTVPSSVVVPGAQVGVVQALKRTLCTPLPPVSV